MAARRLSNFFKIGGSNGDSPPPPSSTSSSSSSSSSNNNSSSPFSRSGSGGNDISDNNSVTSDSTYSTNSDGKGDFFSFRFTSDPSEEDIDNGMKFLYGDPDILEKKCQYSSLGRRFNESEVEGGGAAAAADYDESKLFDRFKPHHKKKITEVPESYFLPTFDPVLQCLLDVQSWTKDSFSENFMNKIEDIDADRDIVSSELNSKIKANYDGLMDCMRGVHAIDLDLSRAIIQVDGSRRKLKGAMATTSQGPMRVVKAKQMRDQLELIVERARGLKFIKDLFKTMVQNLTTGELGRAAEFSRSVLENINTHLYDDYVALKSISAEVQKNISLIRQKTDKALMLNCCASMRRFAVNDYTNIINSYIILDDLSDSLQIDVSNHTDDNSNLRDFERFNCIQGLGPRIQQFQLDDLESGLQKAFIRLIGEGQHRKHKAARQVAIEGVNFAAMDMSAMADLPLEELYPLLTADLIVPSVFSSCELFTDLVHIHYLITQWHRLPFDERNSDLNFLHRSSLTSFDQSFNSDAAIIRLQGNNSSSSSSAAEEDTLIKIKSQIEQLSSTYSMLCQSRPTLWSHLVDTFEEMLHSITLTAAISFEDFIAMVWSINALIKLGTEFCYTNGQTLTACLEEKAVEYFRSTQLATFNMMQQILEADPWSIVPVRISEYGSINKLIMSKVALTKNDSGLIKLVVKAEMAGMGCLKTKIQEDLEKAIESANTTSETSSHDESRGGEGSHILVHFASRGNPFSKEVKSSDSDESPQKVRPETDKPIDITSIINDIFGDEISSPVSKKAQAHNDTMVVTQSILNGLAKYSGKYLQFINIMPCVSVEAFRGLCQLFDFYLCFVFHGFVSPEERAKFFAKHSKMTLPVPDQGRDFETLLSYLERAMSETLASNNSTTGSSSASASASTSASTAKRGSGEDEEINGGVGAGGGGGVGDGIRQEKLPDFASLLRLPSMVELDDESSYLGLNNRIVAGESCWFAARILLDIKPRLLRCLPAQYHSQCEQYINQFQLVASQLRSLINKSMCPMLIRQNWLLSQITELGGWDSKKLKDSHHDFIDNLVVNCQQVWRYMETDDYFGDASPIVREQVWLELCQCAFDNLLDGFARAKKVTPEGRALMMMDTTALHDGLDSIHACRTPRGKHHIDSFLQAMLMPEEEMMGWVNENWQSYAYRHMYGLFTQTLTSILNPKKLRDAIAMIDDLYETEAKCTDNKVDENFNWQKIKDSTGGSISNITQKLRRQSMLGGGGS